jgi:outer membrane lipoprotein-sorting protein
MQRSLPGSLAALASLLWLTPAPAARATAKPADQMLARNIAAMRGVRAIRVNFRCEKKLQVLKRPFVSGGVITIARPNQVRFQTISPYLSCYILTGRKVFSRNQTDRHWHTARLDRQESLAMIMRQFALWSLGKQRNIGKDYSVTMTRTALPPPPRLSGAPPGEPSRRALPAPSREVELFTLTPRNSLLAKAIRTVQLGFPPQSPHLIFIRIASRHDNQSLYWFDHLRMNPHLPASCFKPVGPP